MREEVKTGTSGQVEKLTGKNFEEKVLNSKIPVLVDFWWKDCGPCRTVNKYVEKIAEDWSNLGVGKVDIMEEKELIEKYGVRGVPVLILFHQGKEIKRMVGLPVEYRLRKEIEGALREFGWVSKQRG